VGVLCAEDNVWILEIVSNHHIQKNFLILTLLYQIFTREEAGLQPCESYKSSKREPGAWGIGSNWIPHWGHKYRDLVLQVEGWMQG
jgi:hypothetical protein